MNSVCTVEVALGATGLGPLAWTLLGAAFLALALGVVLVLTRRAGGQRPRGPRSDGRRALLALAVLGVVGLGVLGPQGAAPAQAAASDISYSAGCTLVEIDESSVVFDDATGSLLPGDSVTAITVVVQNRFAGSIELAGEVSPLTGPLAPVLETEVLFDGAPGPVTLAEGEQVTVTVIVTLPASVTDAAQNEVAPIELVLTAAQS